MEMSHLNHRITEYIPTCVKTFLLTPMIFCLARKIPLVSNYSCKLISKSLDRSIVDRILKFIREKRGFEKHAFTFCKITSNKHQ